MGWGSIMAVACFPTSTVGPWAPSPSRLVLVLDDRPRPVSQEMQRRPKVVAAAGVHLGGTGVCP